MGMRKLIIKRFLKNTFYRKSIGNLISQLKILQNRAVFETSSTNISVPKICVAYSFTPTFLNAQERQLSNDVGVSEYGGTELKDWVENG